MRRRPLGHNDLQLPGYKMQDDLCELFMRFRMKRFELSADIAQMYRQVKVHEADRQYQRIIWRDSPDMPLSEWAITIVSWGTTSAQFNAIRALRQCAKDEQHQFPIGADIALNDFYCDDLLTGADDSNELKERHRQIIHLLATAGFQLAKWVTNDPLLAKALNPEAMGEIQLPAETGVLGMTWQPTTDELRIKVLKSVDDRGSRPTKRAVISRIAQIYDPSGIIAPIIVVGKILFRQSGVVESIGIKNYHRI